MGSNWENRQIKTRTRRPNNVKKALPPTSVLQDCGVSAFLEILVLIESSGIFSNFGAESPQPRKALKRYSQFKTHYNDTSQ